MCADHRRSSKDKDHHHRRVSYEKHHHRRGSKDRRDSYDRDDYDRDRERDWERDRRESLDRERERRESVECRRIEYERERRVSQDDDCRELDKPLPIRPYDRRLSEDQDYDYLTPGCGKPNKCNASNRRTIVIQLPPQPKEKPIIVQQPPCQIPPAVQYQPCETLLRARARSEESIQSRKKGRRRISESVLVTEGTGTSMQPLVVQKKMISENLQTSVYPLTAYKPLQLEKDLEEPERPLIEIKIEPGLCPFCHKGYFVRKFTWSGIVGGIFCFPCGIICCFKMRVWCCSFCGESPEGDYHSETSMKRRQEEEDEKERKAREKEEEKERKEKGLPPKEKPTKEEKERIEKEEKERKEKGLPPKKEKPGKKKDDDDDSDLDDTAQKPKVTVRSRTPDPNQKPNPQQPRKATANTGT